MNDQERGVHEAPADETKTRRPPVRSPSPSTISTASSGCPLVRNGESTSSGKSFTFSISSIGQQAPGSPKGTANNAQSSFHSSGPKRPAPTSIAAAQLEQQQKSLNQGQGLAGANGSKSKWHNGNKLAQIMHATKQQGGPEYSSNEPRGQWKSPPGNSVPDKPHKAAQEAGKSLGYNLGKQFAYRASR